MNRKKIHQHIVDEIKKEMLPECDVQNIYTDEFRVFIEFVYNDQLLKWQGYWEDFTGVIDKWDFRNFCNELKEEQKLINLTN